MRRHRPVSRLGACALMASLLGCATSPETSERRSTGSRATEEIIADARNMFRAIPKPGAPRQEPVSALIGRGVDDGEVFFMKCVVGEDHLCAQNAVVEQRPNGETWHWLCLNREGMDRDAMICDLAGVDPPRINRY